MEVSVRQIYIEPEVNYPFSHSFQKLMSEKLTEYIKASTLYIKKYGADFNLTFNLSAKSTISETEIKGPSVFRKTKDLEFTIFLPFDKRESKPKEYEKHLQRLFNAVVNILSKLEINSDAIIENSDAMIKYIVSTPAMFEQSK